MVRAGKRRKHDWFRGRELGFTWEFLRWIDPERDAGDDCPYPYPIEMWQWHAWTSEGPRGPGGVEFTPHNID